MNHLPEKNLRILTRVTPVSLTDVSIANLLTQSPISIVCILSYPLFP